MALLFTAPAQPNRLRTLLSERPAKPLQPTSNGSQCVFQPLSWHASTSSWCFMRFLALASSMRSSQGTVSSSMINCFVDPDVMIMSGRSNAGMMYCGNFSCLLRSTCSCQSEAVYRRPALVLGCGQGFSPALTKAMGFLGAWYCLLVPVAVTMLPATALSTWSWRQQ